MFWPLPSIDLVLLTVTNMSTSSLQVVAKATEIELDYWKQTYSKTAKVIDYFNS